MIKQTLLLSLISSSCSLYTLAQAPPNRNQSSNDTVIHRAPEQKNSPYGNEVPMIDPTNKTIEINGKTYSMSDNHLGGQFEAYLASDTLSSSKAIKYRSDIQQILDYLAPDKTGGAKLRSAFSFLDKAAKYPGDGNLCGSLANAVLSSQLTKKHIKRMKDEIKELSKKYDRLARNMSVSQEKKSLVEPKKVAAPSIQAVTEATRLNLILAKIKLLEANCVSSLFQSKLQFQSLTVQLFIQRRFEHCIMASRFYNLLYTDGDTELKLKKGSDSAKFFEETAGVDPTLAGLDAASAEAIRKVNTLVNAFHNNFKAKRIHAASERLVEAFVIGEFLPSVQTIKSESKEPIQQYIQEANDLVKVLQANDLSHAEKLNDNLQKYATDYNPSEARTYISAKKTESKLNIRDAQMALRFMLKSKNLNERDNQHSKFKTAMEKATLAWPSNPELQDFNDKVDDKFENIVNGDDMLLVARKDFDRYVDTKSWSAVMKDENLPRFIAAFHLSEDPEDTLRAKRLKEITGNFSIVFATLKEAETYHERGYAAAAWELIDIAIKKHPNSLELAKAKALYSGKAATFANTIAKAQDLERISSKSAQALTWYLKAEMIHADSKYAKEGIDRIIAAKYGPKKEDDYEDVAINY